MISSAWPIAKNLHIEDKKTQPNIVTIVRNGNSKKGSNSNKGNIYLCN
jgi:hypothetical protein